MGIKGFRNSRNGFIVLGRSESIEREIKEINE